MMTLNNLYYLSASIKALVTDVMGEFNDGIEITIPIGKNDLLEIDKELYKTTNGSLFNFTHTDFVSAKVNNITFKLINKLEK